MPDNLIANEAYKRKLQAKKEHSEQNENVTTALSYRFQ